MKRIGIMILCAGSFFLPLFALAFVNCPPAYFCFGGRILPTIQVCDEGIILLVVGPRPGPVFLTPLSLFFPAFILPGYNTLGIAAPTLLPCTALGVPTGHAAFPIIRGGTSLTPGL